MLCKQAIDLIVFAEVTSQAVYEARYQRPTCPGGQSGVTIGIGYDLGYQARNRVTGDWHQIGPATLDALYPGIGLTGAAAREFCARLGASVNVPWSIALDVFTTSTLPRYEAMTVQAFPGADKLPPECFGALVSLVYNRGAGMDDKPGDHKQRRLEMRTIRDLIDAGDMNAVPDQFRKMKRLWVGVGGLMTRRDSEAALWESGIKN